MSDESYVEKSVRIGRSLTGHEDVVVTVTDAYGAMPVRVKRGDHVVHLTWSEWGEVSAHVGQCMPLPEAAVDQAEVATCASRIAGLVPYEPLPCVLERGHEVALHCDRLGRRW